MPVHQDPSGRRSVQAEVEVPGTPEEVWQAIASGPGISSWFVPTTLDEHVGGETVSHFSPDGSMDSVAKITAWEPPRRFAAEAEEEPGTVATEWTVEAKDGGTCVVRVVHSWFANSDDWDHQFEGHAHGWAGFFQILHAYLEHFRGQPCSPIALAAFTADPDGWTTLIEPLGLVDATAGQRFSGAGDAPAVSGVVEVANPPAWPSLLLRLEEPAPALAHLFAMSMGEQTMLPVRLYLYGDEAASRAAEIEATWQAWLASSFPAPSFE